MRFGFWGAESVRWRARPSATLALCAVALGVAGCGSSEDSTEDQQAALNQARREGAQDARQDQRIQRLQRQVKRARNAARDDDSSQTSTPVPQSGSTPVTPVSTDPSAYVAHYVPYRPSDPNYSYLAQVPSGGGWTAPIESHPTSGELLRTTLRGPDGTLLIIDYTPNEVPQLGGSYDATNSNLQTNFGSATEYIFSRSEGLPDCNGRPCADFLINNGAGGGWGVLGGGPNLPVAEGIASHVAQTISYGE